MTSCTDFESQRRKSRRPGRELRGKTRTAGRREVETEAWEATVRLKGELRTSRGGWDGSRREGGEKERRRGGREDGGVTGG